MRGGRRYIYYRKDKIVHSLSPSVKCGAPLIRDMALAKVCYAGGCARPVGLPLSFAPGGKAVLDELRNSMVEKAELLLHIQGAH